MWDKKMKQSPINEGMYTGNSCDRTLRFWADEDVSGHLTWQIMQMTPARPQNNKILCCHLLPPINLSLISPQIMINNQKSCKRVMCVLTETFKSKLGDEHDSNTVLTSSGCILQCCVDDILFNISQAVSVSVLWLAQFFLCMAHDFLDALR